MQQDGNNSSARKKLLQYQDEIDREQIKSGFMDRSSSREHAKFMENNLREVLQREESARSISSNKHPLSGKNYHSALASGSSKKLSFKRSMVPKLITGISDSVSAGSGSARGGGYTTTTNGQQQSYGYGSASSSNSNPKIKPLALGKYDSIANVQLNHDQGASKPLQLHDNTQSVTVPQFFNDTDQMRSARQNQLLQVKRVPFEFSFCSYVIQVLIAYGLTFGILYLIKVGPFPYYELLFIFALTLSIVPWKISNLLLVLTALPLTIANNFMGLTILTYPMIFFCYLAVMMFNQRHKIKLLFVIVLGLQLLFGFMFLPAVFFAIGPDTQLYYYLFPLFMFVIRNTIQLVYWIVGYSAGLFLQIPLFLIGLEYGTVLSLPISEIEFWYLLIFFTLQVMNDRTHFFLNNVMVSLTKFCFPKMNTTNTTPDSKKKNNHILPAHWNGFSCIHSFHLVALTYIFTSDLGLYASPYSSGLSLSLYTSNGQWYRPLVVWALVSIYEGMCLILQRKRRNVLLYGYTSNTWYHTISRGLMLVIGLWMFYMGLGIGRTVSIFLG